MSSRTMALVGLVVTLVAAMPLAGQQNNSPSPCEVEYENHNQIDYGPLTVQDLKGTVTDPKTSQCRKCA